MLSVTDLMTKIAYGGVPERPENIGPNRWKAMVNVAKILLKPEKEPEMPKPPIVINPEDFDVEKSFSVVIPDPNGDFHIIVQTAERARIVCFNANSQGAEGVRIIGPQKG